MLLWINNKFQYNTIDVSKQIIKRAAVIEGAGQVRLKVAKLDGNNLPIPLTLSELNAFQNYINKIKFAGTDITITSRTSDLLKLQMDVFYDPLVIDANGGLINNPAIKPVEVAINDFISNLSFNGKLVLTSLVDAVQQVNGVNNPVLISAEAKFGQLNYTPINVDYTADAGHLKIDAAFPLSTTINYIADV
ncbi:MAG: hypothetical protein RQ856_05055 [Candidatus Izemoplasmatales bacterium]|nr:hypothetical protein [Candidatus Izemoplasmatales bacterium]